MQPAALGTGPLIDLAALPRQASGVSRRRLVAGLSLCLIGLPGLTMGMVALSGAATTESVLLVYLLAVVVVAVVGGLIPGLLGALIGFLLANWFLTPPYHTMDVGDPEALTELVVFLVAAAVVSVAVEAGARDRARAARNRLETQMVAALSSAEMRGVTVAEVLQQVRQLYAMTTVALSPESHPQNHLAVVGPPPTGEPALRLRASENLELLGYGSPLFAEDRPLLRALAGTAGRAWENALLAQEAARAEQLAETDRLRSALLTAVGHDLRTPIAGIKAAVSGLRQTDVTWGPQEEQELLATIEDSADRLAELVDNLLAMSRIQAGAVSVHLRPVSVEEVVSRAALHLKASNLVLNIPEQLPPVLADAGLLERVIANLVDNALRFTKPGTDVRIAAALAQSPTSGAAAITIEVVDQGPGVERRRWQEMFVPFQRLGDTTPGGAGLGLAIARGLVEAMDGSLTPSATPGGGLTMTVQLPAAP